MPKVQLGSPYKTKDNVVYVQFWKYLPNGMREKEHIRVGSADSSCSCFRRTKLCAACKKKSQLQAAKIRETLTQVEFNPDASVTVRQFKQSFFAAKRQELNPSTIYNYEYLWRKYVEPFFGNKRLQDVRKADCMGLLRAAVAKAVEVDRELKRTTLLRIKAFMTSFFSYAVDELGILAANPALGKMPKIGRTDEAKTYAYSETETKQIRDAVRKHIAEEHRDLASTLLILGSYTSLSKSELAGLDWEDFDPVEKVLDVRRSRVEGKEGHTKTKARVRKQPLNAVTVQQLLHYKSKTLGTGPIFCGITGVFDSRPLNFKYFEKLLKAALKKEKLRWHGWHAFRRAFATNLYHKDVKEVTVQSLMGHKKGSTIIREHYIKPQDDSAKAAVTLLN